jgi:hypothetical protein
VADVGEWLPWDPNPEEIQESEYQNDQLNKLMQAYRENASKRDAFFEEEKRQKMAEAAGAAAASKKAHAAAGGAGASSSVASSSVASSSVASSSETAAAVFGEKGKELEAADIARDIMDGIDGDLAIARKAAENKSGDSITYA